VGERAVYLGEPSAEARADPPVRGRELSRRGARTLLARNHERNEARGVPQFVAEIAVAGYALQVKADVAVRRGERGEGEAQRISAVGGDAVGVGLARRPLDPGREVWLHETARALLD